MSLHDPIAEMLTKIRNASNAQHRYVDISHSKIKHSVIKIMHDHGFVESFLVNDEKRVIRVFLKYSGRREPIFSALIRKSKPGLRRYIGYQEIPKVRGGLGLVILTTSKGVIDGESARSLRVGGEVICQVM